eukprot:scaffold150505_cov15-Tisochrysis_lutea.AAC.1
MMSRQAKNVSSIPDGAERIIGAKEKLQTDHNGNVRLHHLCHKMTGEIHTTNEECRQNLGL